MCRVSHYEAVFQMNLQKEERFLSVLTLNRSLRDLPSSTICELCV